MPSGQSDFIERTAEAFAVYCDENRLDEAEREALAEKLSYALFDAIPDSETLAEWLGKS